MNRENHDRFIMTMLQLIGNFFPLLSFLIVTNLFSFTIEVILMLDYLTENMLETKRLRWKMKKKMDFWRLLRFMIFSDVISFVVCLANNY